MHSETALTDTHSVSHWRGLVTGHTHLKPPVPDLWVPCGSQCERNSSNCSLPAPPERLRGTLGNLGPLPHSPSRVTFHEFSATSFLVVKCTRKSHLTFKCLVRPVLSILFFSWVYRCPSTASPLLPTACFPGARPCCYRTTRPSQM